MLELHASNADNSQYGSVSHSTFKAMFKKEKEKLIAAIREFGCDKETTPLPRPESSFHSIPNGYELLEYLNSTICDHRLEWVLEQLRAFHVKHFACDDVRILALRNDEGVRLVLIGKRQNQIKTNSPYNL
jgi:hypothetical protein